MTITRNDAVRVLQAADIAEQAPDEARLIVPRVMICQAVLSYCQGADREPLRWDTPLRELTGPSDDQADTTYWLVEDLFWQMDLDELQWEPDRERGAAAETLGDLVLLVEAHVRAFWNQDAVTGCKSQALFYEMRRALGAQPGARSCKPHPRRRLDEILPGPDAEGFCRLLTQRFGARDIPCVNKVFGLLPPAATWLVCWIVALFIGFAFLVDSGPSGFLWFLAYFVVSCLGIGLLLLALSRPTWNYDLTLADLTRHTLKHNAAAATTLRATFAAWAP